MININMDDMFEMHEVIIEVYVGDTLTNRRQMTAPKEMLMANFIQTAKQMKNDSRPLKFKMIVPHVIWDEFEKKQKVLNNGIELSNDARVAWERNNGKV
jgi:hypothetical protein